MSLQSDNSTTSRKEIYSSSSSSLGLNAHPWTQYTLDQEFHRNCTVTPTNYHQVMASGSSSRRELEETQLPLPEPHPMIRANILLDESMRHNWSNHARTYHMYRQVKAAAACEPLNPRSVQEELEFMWFQFRCEWQQLKEDVLNEMKAVKVPRCLRKQLRKNKASLTAPSSFKDEEDDEKEFSSSASSSSSSSSPRSPTSSSSVVEEEDDIDDIAGDVEEIIRAKEYEDAKRKYLELLRQTFYPTTLMELFQKDILPFDNDMNLCLLPSGRGHWAQLQSGYLFQQQKEEQEHARRAAAFKAEMEKGGMPAIAIDDIVLEDRPEMARGGQTTSILGASSASFIDEEEDDMDDLSSVGGLSSVAPSDLSFATTSTSSSRSLQSPPGSAIKRKRAPSNGPLSSSSTESNGTEEELLIPTVEKSTTVSKKKQQQQTTPSPPQFEKYKAPEHFAEVMDGLSQLIQSEGMQCPLEYHTVKFDENTRAQVFMSRRERKAFVLAVLPKNKLFLTV